MGKFRANGGGVEGNETVVAAGWESEKAELVRGLAF